MTTLQKINFCLFSCLRWTTGKVVAVAEGYSQQTRYRLAVRFCTILLAASYTSVASAQTEASLPAFSAVEASASENDSDAANRLTGAGKISNPYDLINQANYDALPVLTGTLGQRLQESTNSRLQQAFSNTGQSIYEYHGQSGLTNMLLHGDRSFSNQQNTVMDVMGRLTLSLDLFPDEGGDSYEPVWSFGDFRQTNGFGADTPYSWDADAIEGHYGVNTPVTPNLATGIFATVSESEAQYDPNAETSIQYDTRTFGLFPYLGYSDAEGTTSLQAAAGFGAGEIKIDTETTGPDSLATEYYAVAASGRKQLTTFENVFGAPAELNLEGEAWTTNLTVEGTDSGLEELRISTSHFDLMLKGTQRRSLLESSNLESSLAVGIQSDSKGQRDANRLTVSGSAVYENSSGLTVEGSNTAKISEGQVRETGLQWNLSYDQNNDDLGAQLDVKSSWGFDSENVDREFWNRSESDSNNESAAVATNPSLATEFAYGFKVVNGLWTVTPYTGAELKPGGQISLRIGNRLAIGSHMSFWIEGEEQHLPDDELIREISIHGSTKW